ncbi:hypothetical protein BDP27DRAFT_720073 [Rhodocollybia butyracea]|uniref:Uncharacterized protein n=1 Tax=Rhodocollybia butyracea TaxID=206335 RepID=A0A9P5U859_9AGAR|nr:hypothetical protein BDP27DRAFT_720073 [Rhodocollybia butyracea]
MPLGLHPLTCYTEQILCCQCLYSIESYHGVVAEALKLMGIVDRVTDLRQGCRLASSPWLVGSQGIFLSAWYSFSSLPRCPERVWLGTLPPRLFYLSKTGQISDGGSLTPKSMSRNAVSTPPVQVFGVATDDPPVAYNQVNHQIIHLDCRRPGSVPFRPRLRASLSTAAPVPPRHAGLRFMRCHILRNCNVLLLRRLPRPEILPGYQMNLLPVHTPVAEAFEDN